MVQSDPAYVHKDLFPIMFRNVWHMLRNITVSLGKELGSNPKGQIAKQEKREKWVTLVV